MNIRANRIRVGAAAAAAVVLGGLAIAAAPAGASGTFDGVLGMKGPGQRFAGTDASGFFNNVIVSRVATPGATETFPVEVINTGTVTSQYQLQMHSAATNPGSGSPKFQLLAGTKDVTALAQQGGSGGYVTTALAPGQKQTLSMKITTASTSTATSRYAADLSLTPIGDVNTLLDEDIAFVVMKSSVGTSDHDIFATSGGQPTVAGPDPNSGDQALMTAPTIALGGSTAFTITLRNDSSAPSAIGFRLVPVDCQAVSSWTTTAKVGTHDVTTAVLDGTYQTPALAPGKSVKVSVTVSAHAPLPADGGCQDYHLTAANATTASGEHQIILVNNVVR
jgi:hypothetical protein